MKRNRNIFFPPVPDPRIHTHLNEDPDKYTCTGNCRRWQPLQEGDDGGSLKQQEFVTPYIGETAKTYLREPTLTLVDPEYDLYEESLLVIERVKETVTDVYKQDAVDVMDDKLDVRRIVQKAMEVQLVEPGLLNFQDYLLYLVGISAVENDGVIQAWHEKRVHDLVRPTTVIKRWDNDVLYTYGGDRKLDVPQYISARDFEAYIRVMPHPEFPSGSSCLCTTYYEFTDKYTTEVYNMTLQDLEWSPKNAARTYVLENMEELRDVCGESRLWGGMHYTASIEAGEQICSGLDDLAFDWVTFLANNATYHSPHYKSDQIGTCVMN